MRQDEMDTCGRICQGLQCMGQSVGASLVCRHRLDMLAHLRPGRVQPLVRCTVPAGYTCLSVPSMRGQAVTWQAVLNLHEVTSPDYPVTQG